jgi:hypothetical protein
MLYSPHTHANVDMRRTGGYGHTEASRIQDCNTTFKYHIPIPLDCNQVLTQYRYDTGKCGSLVLGPRLFGAVGASLFLVVVNVFELSCAADLAKLHLPSLSYSCGLAPFGAQCTHCAQ